MQIQLPKVILELSIYRLGKKC